MNKQTARLQALVNASRNIVFFGGAGVSTESGIPDFRSVDGLYSQQFKYPPEYMLSHSCFVRQPEEFFNFYRSKILVEGTGPNAAHKKLAQLEQAGRLRAVITQNIDGLHQAAGSKTVVELHGSVLKNTCQSCGKSHPKSHIQNTQGVPKCACGGTVKPNVVLYEEGLAAADLASAVQYIAQADLLIIGGTSLVVYPAAGLVNHFSGKSLVIINKTPTGQDAQADLVIAAPIGQVLEEIAVHGV